MSNKVLWKEIEPKEGAALHEPMQTVRAQRKRLAELKALRMKRAKRLAELEAVERAPVDAFADPDATADNVTLARLLEIVGHLDSEIAALETKIVRPKIQAENIWQNVAELEKRWKTAVLQSEALDGRPGDVANTNAAKWRAKLGEAYKAATGHKYSDKRPCGAVVTWTPGPEPGPLLKAIKSLEAPPPPAWTQQPDEERQFCTFGAEETEFTDEQRREHEKALARHRGDRLP